MQGSGFKPRPTQKKIKKITTIMLFLFRLQCMITLNSDHKVTNITK